MKTIQTIAMAAGLASVASAHMEMTFPAPFKSKNNPHAGQDIDYSLVDPIKGAQFPCKGYHSLLGTPAGATTADFKAGESYKVEIAGGAKHDGGSCQASLSYDKGATWTAIHSWIGNCPMETSLPFTVPSDAPAGEALFAWTWFNKVGNREIYMNCAAVNIAGGGGAAASTAFSSRPAMFVANVDGTCTVPDGIDVDFPNPGPDVTVAPNANKGAPVGSCGPAAAPQTPPKEPETPPKQPETPPKQPETPPKQPETPPAGPGNVFITNPAGGAPAAPTGAPAPSESVIPPVPGTPAASPAPSPAPSAPGKPATPPSKTDECNMASSRPAPSTMVTVSKAPGSSEPTGAPSTPVAPVTPPTGGAGAMAAGTACTSEGMWNCIGGTQFQRCAAGMWSAPQAMASGLKCVAGQSDNLSYAKRAVRGARWAAY